MAASTWPGFSGEGTWYKGNLHCHSTESDGDRSPADVTRFYKSRGYSFITLSDHRRVTDISDQASDGFLPIGGMEIDGNHALTGGPFHMLAIGLHALNAQQPGLELPELLDAIAADGGISIFCHPYWLGTCATDLENLDRCVGVEVFNANCEVEIAKGYSTECWDDTLQRGMRFFGFAHDDAHWRSDDFGRAWILVRAAKLDEASILQAIRDGVFYSSSGPTIESLGIDNGTVTVTCSPVAAIHFVGDTRYGQRTAAPVGESITSAEYKLDGRERYLRVECVASDGSRAWSNPVWFV
jgi:hypothetical protein